MDILIKIYRDGKGTSWLQQQPLGTQVWLSKPMKTLSVPSLVLTLTLTPLTLTLTLSRCLTAAG